MIDEVELQADDRMEKAIEALNKELASIRTGRANPGLVEHVQVEYYGTVTPLNQIAGVSIPEARLIVINPWDKQALSAVEKALLKAKNIRKRYTILDEKPLDRKKAEDICRTTGVF